jgi:hypothetical protein
VRLKWQHNIEGRHSWIVIYFTHCIGTNWWQRILPQKENLVDRIGNISALQPNFWSSYSAPKFFCHVCFAVVVIAVIVAVVVVVVASDAAPHANDLS